MHCPNGEHPAAPIQKIETCPTNEDELARKLVSQGSSWNPPISMDEAYRAMHAVDPNEFKHKSYASKVATDVVSSVGNYAASKNQAGGKKQKGMTSRCTRTVKVKSGDSCYWIAKNNGCSLKAFYAWNPAVSTNGQECNELWVGWSVCVSTK